MPPTVRIRRDVLTQMSQESRRFPNMECCGLLAGSDGIITRAFPATNALASITAYEIAPDELFRLMKEIRAAGLQLLGIYHSHPKGDNAPSSRDIERAYYPEAAYFIISSLPEAPKPVRAFSIRDRQVEELNIESI
ncbi:MAG TPA: M67 family metallopeptidase [Candidatus Acidoferrales bacterium]|nr:M67 family metallopeptidase [Candidatus Acidoferrales bacterium]